MYPYFSSLLVANRIAALDGFAEMSSILLHASERYVALGAASGKRVIDSADPVDGQTGDAWLQPFAAFASSDLLQEACAITCETHGALIGAAEAQVRRVDQMVRGMLQHGADWSPWEGAIALQALGSSLNSAERTIHEMTEVANQTLEIAEQEARLMAAATAAPARKRKQA